ncbi:MAG: glycosyltransferase [Desulfovibrio sp.]|nr:glycosyltransferase [Desulfovibrio sp.]
MSGRTPPQNRLLRLLLVVHAYPPYSHAGTENYVRAFAGQMAAQDFDVTVFYPVLDATAAAPGLRVKAFENYTATELVTNRADAYDHLEDPGIELIFQAVLKNFKPDVVHFHHTYTCLPFSLILRAKQSGCFTCLTLHDFWYICLRTYMLPDGETLCAGPEPPEKCALCLLPFFTPEEDQTMEDLKNILVEYCVKRLDLARLILADIDLVTAPSRFVLAVYSRHVSLRRNLVVPLGIEAPAVEKRPARSGPLRFGFLGNMSLLKNVHGLLSAFAQVRGKAELHIYGKIRASAEEILKPMLRVDPRVVWHGPYSAGMLGSILTDMDVGVVPSFFENYPLVLREFLSAGIPVVAARVGGIPEIVRNAKNGILFDPHKTGKLASILQSLVDSPQIVNKLKAGIEPPKTMLQDASDWSGIYLDGVAN